MELIPEEYITILFLFLETWGIRILFLIGSIFAIRHMNKTAIDSKNKTDTKK